MDGQGTLTNNTAKWFLISLFFLLFVDAGQVKFWLQTTFALVKNLALSKS